VSTGSVVRALCWLAGLLGYAMLSHRFIVTQPHTVAADVFAIASAAGMACAAVWTTRARWWLVALVVAAAFVFWAARERFAFDTRWLYLLQHAGAHAALAVVFGRSLAGGCEPLVTRIAVAVQGPQPPDILSYTRSVTVVWAGYFTVMSLCSLALFAWGKPVWWSVLANFATPALIAGLFVGEYAIRRFRFPQHPHARLLDGIRAAGRPH
jgi:uncharacterized membrane protein